MKFRFLEHTADVYIEAFGKTLEEAFENAALAMFEVMTDTKTVEQKQRETLAVEAEDKEELLYKWLENLIIKFDTKNILFSKFQINKIVNINGTYRLDAFAWGEPYDENHHSSRVDVKSVTYHRMEIGEIEGKVTLRFILDI